MADDLDTLDFPSILASSVHDMKNAIGFLLSDLEEFVGGLPEQYQQPSKINPLRYQAKRLNGSLVQLLTLYKLERQQYFVDIGEHEVRDFLNEQVLEYREWLKHGRIGIELQCSDDLLWFFDRNLVSSVINNVINNVYKYTRDVIQVTADIDQNWLRIMVADNGEGYPESLLGTFTAGPSGINMQTGSTGLGLYFAAVVAHTHVNRKRRGYITLDNQGPQNGGRFILHLP